MSITSQNWGSSKIITKGKIGDEEFPQSTRAWRVWTKLSLDMLSSRGNFFKLVIFFRVTKSLKDEKFACNPRTGINKITY